MYLLKKIVNFGSGRNSREVSGDEDHSRPVTPIQEELPQDKKPKKKKKRGRSKRADGDLVDGGEDFISQNVENIDGEELESPTLPRHVIPDIFFEDLSETDKSKEDSSTNQDISSSDLSESQKDGSSSSALPENEKVNIPEDGDNENEQDAEPVNFDDFWAEFDSTDGQRDKDVNTWDELNEPDDNDKSFDEVADFWKVDVDDSSKDGFSEKKNINDSSCDNISKEANENNNGEVDCHEEEERSSSKNEDSCSKAGTVAADVDDFWADQDEDAMFTARKSSRGDSYASLGSKNSFDETDRSRSKSQSMDVDADGCNKAKEECVVDVQEPGNIWDEDDLPPIYEIKKSKSPSETRDADKSSNKPDLLRLGRSSSRERESKGKETSEDESPKRESRSESLSEKEKSNSPDKKENNQDTSPKRESKSNSPSEKVKSKSPDVKENSHDKSPKRESKSKSKSPSEKVKSKSPSEKGKSRSPDVKENSQDKSPKRASKSKSPGGNATIDSTVPENESADDDHKTEALVENEVVSSAGIIDTAFYNRGSRAESSSNEDRKANESELIASPIEAVLMLDDKEADVESKIDLIKDGEKLSPSLDSSSADSEEAASEEEESRSGTTLTESESVQSNADNDQNTPEKSTSNFDSRVATIPGDSEASDEETGAFPVLAKSKFSKGIHDLEAPVRRRSVLLPDAREREDAGPPTPPPLPSSPPPFARSPPRSSESSAGSRGRVRHVSDTSTDGDTHDDGIMDFLGKENDRAEARLAARRQVRVEAREIRMRELERVQKEQQENSDKIFDGHCTTPPHVNNTRQPSMSPRERPTLTPTNSNSYHSSRRSSEDSMDDGVSLRDIRHELKEVEDKFRKAMIANAQLDNEKAAHAYQVELLKDRLEDLEEAHALLNREYKERSREHEALKRVAKKLKEDLLVCKMCLDERDRLIADYGLIIVGGDMDEKGEATPRVLVSREAADVLETVGEGSLDVRLKCLANEKNELADEVRHLKLELEEERNGRRSDQAMSNGPLPDDVQQTLNDYRFRLQKAEQDTSTLQATVARLESQVIRYKSASEASEKAEEELKQEKRKLLREHRESIARMEELETSNSHLQRRMDKLKNAKSTLLKEL